MLLFHKDVETEHLSVHHMTTQPASQSSS